MQEKSSKLEIQRLRDARKKAHLTLTQLANLSGYAVSTISSVENGHYKPSTRFRAKIIEVLHLNPDWLKTGNDPVFLVPKGATAMHVWPDIFIPQAKLLIRQMPELGRLFEIATALQRESGEDVANYIATALGDMDEKKALTVRTENSTESGMHSKLATLLARLNRATRQRGRKVELARFLGVPHTRVSEWLSGKTEPGGETTLRLLAWVTAEEAKQQDSAGSATSPPAPKTR